MKEDTNKNVGASIANPEKSITLIALIITIVIMLILVVATLTIVIGPNGIIAKAKEAKTETENQMAYEQGNMASGIVEVNGLKYAIKNDGTLQLVQNGGQTTENRTLARGDEVTISGEKFYVLADNGTNITLFAEKNVDTTTLHQSDSVNTVAFSTNYYWESETEYPFNLNTYTPSDTIQSIEETDAIEIARKYATETIENDATGRLMTYEEATELNDSGEEKLMNLLYKTNYWLGTAYYNNNVSYVYGNASLLLSGRFNGDDAAGVRPVIEVSKSAIQ